jgi:MerR family redox-sensitive transcriptional activator SoxR
VTPPRTQGTGTPFEWGRFALPSTLAQRSLVRPRAAVQRRFARADIRRLSFAEIAQTLGLSIAEIAGELASLPLGRADWQAISRRIRGRLQQRIAMLELTRDKLDGCIGCGCLSLESCALYNPGDRAGRAGAGPRFLLGDRPAKPQARVRPTPQ